MNAQVATLRHTAPIETSDLLRQILAAIQGVRYGQVQIIIQDSRVVQIDKTEKLRLV
ncbi:MAG: YezD family protein [candidate division NC10 bacterium]